MKDIYQQTSDLIC